MVESNVTRRRVLQGAGAIGVASLGSTVISAQEGGGGGDQGAAVRVAHVSPDAPNVDVRLNSQGSGATAGGGNETAGNDTGPGGGNETNETGGQTGDGGTEIGGVAFGDVSSYNEVEPGTYQVEIVPASGGIGGFIEDIFGGGGGDQETVLFDGEIEVQEGTTYTVVAFGEVARGPVPAEDAGTGGAAAGNETGGIGGTETDGAGTNETGGAGLNETGGNETGGVGANETDATGAGGATGGDGPLVEELAFGESQTVELDAGDYTLAIEEAGAGGATGGTEDGLGGTEDAAGANETSGIGGNETDAAGANETGGTGLNDTGGVGAGQNETDGVGGDAATGQGSAGQTGGSDRGFQVQVLEDDVSDPGDGTARVRLFHAVPDVDAVSISQVSEAAAPAGGGAGGNETGGAAGNQTGGAGANETGGGAAANESDGIGGAGAGQNETGGAAAGQNETGGAGANETGVGAGTGGAARQEGVRRATVSLDGNGVYGGFATGYFDTQAAATAGNQGGGNETGGENATGVGNDTGAGNETGNATAGGDGEQVAEDASDAEFQLVTVETAQGGERADGGTGGILDLALPADD